MRGMQPSIRQFVVTKEVAAQIRADREARERERELRRAEQAASLGLPWPKPTKRRCGAPSREDKWRSLLLNAIEQDVLPPGIAAEPPEWWAPGMPLTRSAEDVLEMMEDPLTPAGSSTIANSGGGDGSEGGVGDAVGDGDIDGDEESPGKRAHTVVADEVKEWFIGFKELMEQRHGWGMAQSLRYARKVTP